MKKVLLSTLPNLTLPTKVVQKTPLLAEEISTSGQLLSSNNILSKSDKIQSRTKKEYLPIILKTIINTLNFKNFTNKTGVTTVNKVSLFNVDSDIVLEGEYSQNKFDFPKFNLNIKTLEDVTFRFILSIKKDLSDSTPQLYTSAEFYTELVESYRNNNPYMVANAIKSNAIVSITYSEYLDIIEQFRATELNVAKVGVVVHRNLFVDSNYNLIDGALPPALESNPSTNIDDLVRYIDWVVSKPNPIYNERLLDPTDIGQWVLVTPTGIEGAPPPTPPTPPNDAPPNTTPTYPPIGRQGFYEGEEITASNGDLYTWTNLTGGRWLLQGPSTPAPGGNNTGGAPTGTGGRPQL